MAEIPLEDFIRIAVAIKNRVDREALANESPADRVLEEVAKKVEAQLGFYKFRLIEAEKKDNDTNDLVKLLLRQSISEWESFLSLLRTKDTGGSK